MHRDACDGSGDRHACRAAWHYGRRACCAGMKMLVSTRVKERPLQSGGTPLQDQRTPLRRTTWGLMAGGAPGCRFGGGAAALWPPALPLPLCPVLPAAAPCTEPLRACGDAPAQPLRHAAMGQPTSRLRPRTGPCMHRGGISTAQQHAQQQLPNWPSPSSAS